jgi:MFS family permease
LTETASANGSVSPTPRFSPRYVRGVVVLLMLTAMLSTADRTLMAILLDDIKREIPLTDRDLGFLLGFGFVVTHLIAAIPIARMSDLYSRRWILTTALGVWSCVTLVTGLSQTFWHLLLCRLGLGIGEAAGSPASNSLVADLTPPDRRTRALSLLSIGGMVGGGVGMLVGGWISQLYDWRWAFIVFGVPGFVIAATLACTLRDPPRGYSDGLTEVPSEDGFLDVLRHLISIRTYVLVILAACLAGMVSYGRIIWEPTFLRRIYGMEPGVVGTWYIVLYTLPTIAGAYLGAWLVDRLVRKHVGWYLWLPILGHLAGLPFILLYLLAPADREFWGIPVGFYFAVVGSLIGIFWNGSTMALAQILVRPHMRTVSAAIWNGLFTLVGLGVGPFVVGDLSVRFEPELGVDSLRYALVVVSLVPILASLILMRASKTLRADLAGAGHSPDS